MTTADWLFLLLALAGHLALGLLANNYVHALPLGFRLLRIYSTLLHAFVPGVLLLVAYAAINNPEQLALVSHWSQLPGAVRGYLLLCWAMALGPLPWWTWLRLRQRPPAELLSNHSQHIDLVEQLGRRPIGAHGMRRWLTYLPGNDVFRLEVNEKQVRVPRLPRELDGFSIAHISDLHLEGAIGPEFFQEIVARVNELQADVIAVTGDVFDRRECLDWVPQTLAGLRAPLGIYFILGNHDLRLGDVRLARQALTDIGWIDLGGRWIETTWRDQQVLLVGNELPWIAAQTPCPPLQLAAHDADAETEKEKEGVPHSHTNHRQRPLRVALAHTPDQYPWARRHGMDLMLAGHCHGGQIRLPIVGPLVAPSRRGARYASGTFFERPTLLHVSRGISSLQTVRYNCPAEITRLVLRSPIRASAPDVAPAEGSERSELVGSTG